MPSGTPPAARNRALADIPIVVARDAAPAKTRGVAPPARSATEPYRAYKPQPFTREERDSVTILFGNLHWRAERVMQGAMENLGYRAQIMPGSRLHQAGRLGEDSRRDNRALPRQTLCGHHGREKSGGATGLSPAALKEAHARKAGPRAR